MSHIRSEVEKYPSTNHGNLQFLMKSDRQMTQVQNLTKSMVMNKKLLNKQFVEKGGVVYKKKS